LLIYKFKTKVVLWLVAMLFLVYGGKHAFKVPDFFELLFEVKMSYVSFFL